MLALVAGLVLVVLVVGQRFALRDLRRVEADYVAAREPTACATQGLLPFAFSGEEAPSSEERDEAVAELVAQAARDVAEARKAFLAHGGVVPFPPLGAAHGAVRQSMDKQLALYEAMVGDPANSDDELRASGLANTAAERRLDKVRSWLFVGTNERWARRFICKQEAPFIPPP